MPPEIDPPSTDTAQAAQESPARADGPVTRHAVLVECRRAFAVTSSGERREPGEDAVRLRERSIALAIHRLAPIEPSQWLVDRAGWPAHADENGLHVVGDAAIELASIVDSTESLTHPLDAGDLSTAPPSAWNGLQIALERILSDVRGDGSDLVAVVPSLDPSRRTLWLHAVSDTLLAERFPGLTTQDAGIASLPTRPASGVDWGWWIGDIGTSVATRYCGEAETSWLSGGTRALLEKAATTGGEAPLPGRPIPRGSSTQRALSIYARDFLARLVTQSIQMQRELWWDPVKPGVHLRLVCPGEFVSIFETATMPVVRDVAQSADVTIECVAATSALRTLVRPT